MCYCHLYLIGSSPYDVQDMYYRAGGGGGGGGRGS